ncbi:hypothetical protein L286_11710 [Sphingobium sp. HDIP04]|nr:hypothetical protein L286_11710 [Sphingobium sp. HDIP04]
MVTWEEADAHLRLGGDEEEKLFVESLIAAATGHIDGPDGWLGRAIGEQELEAYLPAPEFDRILHLPFPPIIDVTSIEARTGSGWDVIDPSIYDLRGAEVWRKSGANWPTWLDDQEAVKISYRAGYEIIPAPIKAAILLMVADLFRSRASFATMTVAQVPMSVTVERLLAPYRVWY